MKNLNNIFRKTKKKFSENKKNSYAIIFALAFAIIGSVFFSNIFASGDNIALGKNVRTSTNYSNKVNGKKAVDGKSNTRWASKYSNNQWIYIDLGQKTNIDKVVINWEVATGRDYDIQVSDTALGNSWKTVSEKRGNIETGKIIHDNLNTQGRYVRMLGRVPATSWGFSIWEFEIFENKDSESTPATKDNLALNKSISTSTSFSDKVNGPKAVDDKSDTRWASMYENDQWISVDLGQKYFIDKVVINWEVATGRDYDIQVANSSSGPWTTVSETRSNSQTGILIHDNINTEARYVRMYGRVPETRWGFSIWEFEVYAGYQPTSDNIDSTNNVSENNSNELPTDPDSTINPETIVDNTKDNIVPKYNRSSMWIWNWRSLDTNSERNDFIQFSKINNIQRIYMESESLVSNDQALLSNIISDLNNNNIEVELLFGYHPWTLEKNHSAALNLINKSVEFYNNPNYAKPVGVHYDVEPSSLTEWRNDQIGTANQLLDLYQKLNSAKGPLELSADIQMVFNRVNITRNGITKTMTEWAIDYLDNTVIMSYRDSALVPETDSIVSHSVLGANYASQVNKNFISGVETTCGVLPEKVTFCEEGFSYFNEEISKVRGAMQEYGSFSGIAIHDYTAYRQFSNLVQN